LNHRDCNQRDWNRREWLATSLGVAALPEILEAQHKAREAAKSGKPPEFFDAQSASDIESLTAEIVPTTSTPGAKEAGVVYFIGHTLTTIFKDDQPAYRKGLADVNAKRLEMFPGTKSCAALTSDQRIALLKSIESTPFFRMLRTHTIVGFLADPVYGGNPAGGYQAMGFQPAHIYKPPFGWYDDKANGGEN
jgi:gluconate 2-dehydrogenase gamma chain